jgi:hypothetical protein
VTVAAGVVPDSEGAETSLRDVLAAALDANREMARLAAVLREENGRLREENGRLREENARLRAEGATRTPHASPPASGPSPPPRRWPA